MNSAGLKRHLPKTGLRTPLTDELRFRAWSAGAAGRENRRRLRRLRDKYRGSRCFVMGNGPSLLKCDLNLLESEVTIASNANYLIWDQLTYVPTFLTVEDTLVLEDRAAELRGLEGTTRIFPFDHEASFGPPSESLVYVNFLRNYPGVPRFSYAFDRRCFWGGTVSFLNLQLAAFLGCKEIVLIGFDHSYKVPEDKIRDNVIVSDEADVNHIHPDYFGPGYRWHDPHVHLMEQAYQHARSSLGEAGIRVLNATVGGKLEVFDRVPYTSLVQ